MNHAAHNKLISFIWSIADDCLRDVYVRGKYRDVILPMVVLRRLDALLEPSKEQVLQEVAFQKNEMNLVELDDAGLKDAAGYVFFTTSASGRCASFMKQPPTTSKFCLPMLKNT